MARAEDIQKEVDEILEDYFQSAWKEELRQAILTEVRNQMRLEVTREINKRHSKLHNYIDSFLFDEDYDLNKLEALSGALVENQTESFEMLIETMGEVTSLLRDQNNSFGSVLRVLLFQTARKL